MGGLAWLRRQDDWDRRLQALEADREAAAAAEPAPARRRPRRVRDLLAR